MIDFETWFANISSASDLIASQDALPKAWLHGDKTITSAYDYSELAEQILGDLDLEVQAKRFSDELEKMNAIAAFADFSRAFLKVDQSVNEDPALRDPSLLLKSSEWTALRNAARAIIGLPGAAPYRKRSS